MMNRRGAMIGGRGSGKRPTIMPNLAAAGRLETPPQNVPSTSDQRGRGGRAPKNEASSSNRGGSNRGRGRGKFANDRIIIESEGIFSMGFANNELSRRGAKRIIKGEETVIGKVDGFEMERMDEDVPRKKSRTKKEKEKFEEKSDTSRRICSYADYWSSDDELDKEELADLLCDDFISGLRRGSQMPRVLPEKDEPQFNRLLSKKSKEIEIGESTPQNGVLESDINQIKREILGEHNMPQQKGSPIAPLMECIIKDPDNPLMLLQLPASLSMISSSTSDKVDESTSQQQPKPPEKAQQQLPSQEQSNSGMDSNRSKHLLEQFPPGVEIGKLQLMKSGRVLMNINGEKLDVSKSIPSNSSEAIVRIETSAASSTPGPPPSTLQEYRRSLLTGVDVFSAIPSSSAVDPLNPNQVSTTTNVLSNTQSQVTAGSVRNSIQIFGDVPYHFVCSFNLDRVFNESNAKNDKNGNDQQK